MQWRLLLAPVVPCTSRLQDGSRLFSWKVQCAQIARRRLALSEGRNVAGRQMYCRPGSLPLQVENVPWHSSKVRMPSSRHSGVASRAAAFTCGSIAAGSKYPQSSFFTRNEIECVVHQADGCLPYISQRSARKLAKREENLSSAHQYKVDAAIFLAQPRETILAHFDIIFGRRGTHASGAAEQSVDEVDLG